MIPKAKSNASRAILYTVLVFGAGFLAGALVMNLTEHYWWHPAARANSQPPSNNADRDHYLEEFRRELKLTEEQAREVEQILDETMKQYADLHVFTHHIREDGISRIRAVLNEEQRRNFEEILKKAQQAREKENQQPRTRK